MKVHEMIAALQGMPADASVGLAYDGGLRLDADAVWLSQRGSVAIGWSGDPVYNDADRIIGAPLSGANRYLHVYEMLGLPEPCAEEEW